MTQNLSDYRNLRNEELWTPQIVYDVVPPGELVRDSYSYKEGDDNFDQEAAETSLFDGVRDFFENLFGSLGDAVSGVAQAGIGLVVKVFDGIVSLATSVGKVIGNVFGRLGELIFGSPKPPPEPLPDIFSPIAADLEGELAPFFQNIDDALAESNALGETAVGHAQDALDIAEASNAAVHDAAGVIRGLVDESHAAADQALQYASDAQGYASSAQGYAADAVAAADQADQLNSDVQAAKLLVDQAVAAGQAEVKKAQGHAADAAVALAAAQGVQIDVEADAGEVQTKLVQITGYHSQVLTAQGKAITAASGAAQSALDAAGELAAAQAVQVDVNAKLSQAVAAAGTAAAQAGVATNMNSQAIAQVAIATQKASDAAAENASALAAASDANKDAAQAYLLAQQAQDSRDDAQDSAARANADALQAMQQYVSRVMFLPDSTKVNSVNNPHWTVTFQNGKRKLKALSGWVGEWVYNSAVHYSGDFGPVIEGGTVSAASREFLLDTATSSAILMYTIRPGIPRLASPVSVNKWLPPRDAWTRIPVSDTADGLSNGVFTAKTAGDHEILLRVGWHATTRDDSYGIRVQRQVGTSAIQDVRTIKQVGIGPLLPGQDGYRTQSISVSVNMVVGEKIYLEAWAGATGTDQRTIRDSRVQIGWVDAPKNTSDIT